MATNYHIGQHSSRIHTKLLITLSFEDRNWLGDSKVISTFIFYYIHNKHFYFIIKNNKGVPDGSVS